jgi:hypothetical protein
MPVCDSAPSLVLLIEPRGVRSTTLILALAQKRTHPIAHCGGKGPALIKKSLIHAYLVFSRLIY